MAEVKYNDVNWAEGTPVAGERLATNSHYTGEHIGVPMQDASVSGVEAAHGVETATVRYGTIMQDAKDSSFPTVKA